MNKEIKKFIEKHVDLLDSDPVEFFYQTWLNYTLQRSDIAYMSTMLSEAGIEDIEENIEDILVYGFGFAYFCFALFVQCY